MRPQLQGNIVTRRLKKIFNEKKEKYSKDLIYYLHEWSLQQSSEDKGLISLLEMKMRGDYGIHEQEFERVQKFKTYVIERFADSATPQILMKSILGETDWEILKTRLRRINPGLKLEKKGKIEYTLSNIKKTKARQRYLKEINLLDK